MKKFAMIMFMILLLPLVNARSELPVLAMAIDGSNTNQIMPVDSIMKLGDGTDFITKTGEPVAWYPEVDTGFMYELKASATGFEPTDMYIFVDPDYDTCINSDCSLSTPVQGLDGQSLTAVTTCSYSDKLDGQLCEVEMGAIPFWFVMDEYGMNIMVPLTPLDQGDNLAPVISNPTASVLSGNAPLSVDFTASISDDGEFTAEFYPDANTKHIVSDTLDVTHTYTVPGTYEAKIIAIDDHQATTEHTFTIVVNGNDIPEVPVREYTLNVASLDAKPDANGDNPFIGPTQITVGGIEKVANPFAEFVIDSHNFYEVTFAGVGYLSETVDLFVDPSLSTISGNLQTFVTKSKNEGFSPITVETRCQFVDKFDSYACFPMEQSTGEPYAAYFYDKAEDSILLLNTIAEDIEGNLAPELSFSATPLSGQAPLDVDFTVQAVDDRGIESVSIFYDDGTPLTLIDEDTTVSHTFGPGRYTVTARVVDTNKVMVEKTVTIVVSQAPENVAPTADAGVDTLNVKVGEVINFDGSASYDTDGTIVSYAWNFGNNDVATGVTTTYSYSLVGQYVATLLVTDNDGATHTDTVTVIVTEADNLAPTANAGADITVKTGLNFNLDGRASTDADGSIVKFSWTLADGTLIGEGDLVTYSIDTAGTYTITLEITDNKGATNTDTVVITVEDDNLAPTADAGADITVIKDAVFTLDGSASFDTDGSIVSYSWDFGNSIIKTGVGVSHSYDTAGTYPVTLTVTDDKGAVASDTITVTVRDSFTAPIAVAGNDQTITLGQTVSVDGSASTDSDGSIVLYSWEFDSTTVKTGVTSSHTYDAVGVYTVRLTVTDNDGLTHTDSLVITVNAVNLAPFAIAGTDMTVHTNQVVAFDGSGSFDIDGNIVAYLWDFGDNGAAATTANANHMYTTPGVYTVSLIVTDDDGATDSDSITVVVNGAPTANAGGPYYGDVDEKIEFSAHQSTDDQQIVSYSWDFGDGQSATGEKPTHEYNAEGIYTVTLTVTDNDGLVGIATTTATIVEPVYSSSDREVSMVRIVSMNGDMVMAGDIASYKFTFENTGSVDLKNLKVTAIIPELGIQNKVGPFDLDTDDRETKQLILEIPDYVSSGDEFMVRFKVSEGGETFRTKHRFITIV